MFAWLQSRAGIGSVIGLVLAIIGFGGLPDDFVTWTGWIKTSADWLSGDAGRWLLMGVGVAVIALANVDRVPLVREHLPTLKLPSRNGIDQSVPDRFLEGLYISDDDPIRHESFIALALMGKVARLYSGELDCVVRDAVVELAIIPRNVSPQTVWSHFVCLVQTPDGRWIISKPIGVGGVAKAKYPDDFLDALPLRNGEHKVAWIGAPGTVYGPTHFWGNKYRLLDSASFSWPSTHQS